MSLWKATSPYLAVAGLIALVASGSAVADELNMTPGVTDISKEVFWLHNTIFGICVVIGVIVFGAMFYSILMHRKSAGHEAAQFHESTKLEILWTIIPVFILIGMAVPATDVLIKMYDTGGEDMTVEVRGYQWKWQYKYLDDNMSEEVSFFSTLSTPQDEIRNQSTKGEYYLLEVDNPLVIPVNQKVRFLVTANDVIHAWWVPEFGIKRDAVPGMLNELWTIVPEPGVYRGQCTELCGKDHGFMPVVVQAVSQEDYDVWYAEKLDEKKQLAEILEKDWTADELYTRGEEVYGKFCASCHQANGAGVPPVFPSLLKSPVIMEGKEAHIDIVYNGKPGTAMQAFAEQLNPVDLAAVVHYERNAWGNDTGDVTLPKEILAFGDK